MTLRKRTGGAAVQATRRIPSDISIRLGETFRLGSIALFVASVMRSVEAVTQASEVPDKGGHESPYSRPL